jgi:hypothetical protein
LIERRTGAIGKETLTRGVAGAGWPVNFAGRQQSDQTSPGSAP